MPTMSSSRKQNSPLVDKQQEALALNYFNAFGMMTGDSASGDLSEFEKSTGRVFVYKQADGSIVDKDGSVVSHITDNMMVLTRH